MEAQRQYVTRRNNLLGRALVSMSAGLLFLTISLQPYLLYQVIGFLFIGFSLVFLIAALGLAIPIFSKVIRFAENSGDQLWLTFMIVSFVLILVTWIDGIQKIDKASWLKQPYFWIGPVWLIVFAGVFITTSLHQIITDFRQAGRQTATRRTTVSLAFICGVITIPLILTKDLIGLDTRYIILILAIGLVLLSVRLLLQDR